MLKVLLNAVKGQIPTNDRLRATIKRDKRMITRLVDVQNLKPLADKKRILNSKKGIQLLMHIMPQLLDVIGTSENADVVPLKADTQEDQHSSLLAADCETNSSDIV